MTTAQLQAFHRELHRRVPALNDDGEVLELLRAIKDGLVGQSRALTNRNGVEPFPHGLSGPLADPDEVITLDLSQARTNEEYLVIGDQIAVAAISGTLDVRFNHLGRPAHRLNQERVIRTNFDKLYFTNTAQAGAAATLAIGREASYQDLQVLTSLRLADIAGNDIDPAEEHLPVEQGSILNSSIAVDVDWFGANIAPTLTPSMHRLMIRLASTAVARVLLDDGATVDLALDLNGGAALTGNALYSFDILLLSGQSYNLQYTGIAGPQSIFCSVAEYPVITG